MIRSHSEANLASALPTSGFMASWNRFWFSAVDPRLICLMRLAVGLLLLYIYGTLAPSAMDYLGPRGWIDQQAIHQLSLPDDQGWAELDGWTPSLWFLTGSEPRARLLYVYLLLAIVSFTAGFCSRLSNLLVLIGHLSAVHRGSVFSYGVDNVLAMLLLYMLLAPTGSRYSLDAWIAGRRGRTGKATGDPAGASVGANLALRCIQLHMCVIYLCSGLSKLQGQYWWDGTAVWDVIMSNEIHFFDLRWVAQIGEFGVVTLSLFASFFTLAYEIGFPLLVWNRRLRPVFLLSAVLLHGGIAAMMGLWAFGSAMIIGCSSFVPLEWLPEREPRRAHDNSPSVPVANGSRALAVEAHVP